MEDELDMLDLAPAMDEDGAEDLAEQNAMATPEQAALQTLMAFTEVGGDISQLLSEEKIASLGAAVVRDYEMDCTSRKGWADKAKRALDRASQEKIEAKDYPWTGASNVSYPMLTVAALQFAARAYPAVVKNDEAVQVKVFGTPPAPLDPMVMQAAQQDPQAQQMVMAHQQQSQRHQAKKARGRRVGDYLNHCLFYGEDDWEGDTDAMLHQLPVVGCAFRKTFASDGYVRSTYVPALRLVVNQDTKTLETAPRVTEEIHEVYPYQIEGRMRSGLYRTVVLPVTGEDDQAPRMLLEQHRMEDLDGDGMAEPYIVTVDKELSEVLRIEPAYSREGVRMIGERVVGFDRWMPYTKYGFIPDLKGRFYDIGFGHLLDQISEVVNTMMNQLIDAGHAQIAGGGFISGGVRMQGAGQTSRMTFKPGEYKYVNVAPGQLQGSIYERTFPNPSPVAFQLLDMMLGAVKDITSTKDVLTGEQPASAPVGTTLAMIEQGLQVFSSIYKRIYRGLKAEFTRLYDAVRIAGDEQAYMDLLDDPQANFAEDFSPEGRDIVPVSDPSASTKMQSMGKAQMLLQLLGKGLNDQEIILRALTAFDVDDPEELLPPPAPQQPPPDVVAKVKKDEASAQLDTAKAGQIAVETAQTERMMNDPFAGGLPGLAGPSGQPVDVQGPQPVF